MFFYGLKCHFAIASAVLAIMLRSFEIVGVLPSKAATSSIYHTTAVVAHPIFTDLTVCIFSPTILFSTCELDPRIWHRVKKILYLYTSQRRAWLYVTLANEEKLVPENLLVMDIRVGKPNPNSDHSWESRPGGDRAPLNHPRHGCSSR